MLGGNLCAPRGAASPCKPRLSRLDKYGLLSSYQNNNLSRHEVPLAVEHPRETENPPGTPSGRRLRLEIAKSPVERLFPPSGGVSRGSVRVGGETFLLPSYGFSFGYKRKGVSFAPPTKTRKKSMYGVRTAVKPAGGGLPSSVTAQCQGTAPCHLPQRGRLWRLSRSRL